MSRRGAAQDEVAQTSKAVQLPALRSIAMSEFASKALPEVARPTKKTAHKQSSMDLWMVAILSSNAIIYASKAVLLQSQQ